MSILTTHLAKRLHMEAVGVDFALARPDYLAKNPHMPARVASVLAAVRASGASLTPDQMAMVGSLSAFAGQPVAIPAPAAAVPVMARVPLSAFTGQPMPAPARAPLSADDAQAILAEGKRLRLDAMAVKMVALGVPLADARDLLATAAGGAGGTVPTVPAVPASGVQRPAPAPAGAGGASASAVNREAVAAARAYAASRRARVA